MRPGLQTTEFWLSLILAIVGLVLVGLGESRGSDVLTAVGGAILAASGMGYSLSRGAAKRGEGPGLIVLPQPKEPPHA